MMLAISQGDLNAYGTIVQGFFLGWLAYMALNHKHDK